MIAAKERKKKRIIELQNHVSAILILTLRLLSLIYMVHDMYCISNASVITELQVWELLWPTLAIYYSFKMKTPSVRKFLFCNDEEEY